MKNGIKFGLIIIVVIVVLIGAALIDGNKETEEEKPVEESSTQKITSLKTCAELNGYICGVGDECGGKWLDASDTFSCCSKKCEASAGGEALSIEPFDLESGESEELGSLTQ